MKLPNNLLNEVSGKKRKGVTILAVVLMAIASVVGLFFGLSLASCPACGNG